MLGCNTENKLIKNKNGAVFIVDEAQQTYAHINFWLGFIKERSGSGWGSKVFLLPPMGAP